ncbi:MAG: hypothetical protein AABZ70_20120 [candidate division NC10 bacterium]
MDALFSHWQDQGVVTRSWFLEQVATARGGAGGRRSLFRLLQSQPE